MTVYDECRYLYRLLGRVQVELKCRRRGPPTPGKRRFTADTSCRARFPEEKIQWCPTCRLLEDIANAPKRSAAESITTAITTEAVPVGEE